MRYFLSTIELNSRAEVGAYPRERVHLGDRTLLRGATLNTTFSCRNIASLKTNLQEPSSIGSAILGTINEDESSSVRSGGLQDVSSRSQISHRFVIRCRITFDVLKHCANNAFCQTAGG
uniref:Uncharacterized protein n=1 Tax=Spongospora subterranea TaxID=70186 RepID=A0A0H5R8X8_9EUKA|eukprot:CRZ04829.1 hypothetical protein [Spongospora subterranea]